MKMFKKIRFVLAIGKLRYNTGNEKRDNRY